MRTATLVCILLLLAVPQAQAGGVAANPTRPTFSDNAHPMAKGHLEFELGGHFWDNDQFGLPFLLKSSQIVFDAIFLTQILPCTRLKVKDLVTIFTKKQDSYGECLIFLELNSPDITK